MKIGVVSDVHGDIAALDSALGHLHRLGCDPILCAGDLLDIEPSGEEVIQRLKSEGVICIRGNHERWALDKHSPEGQAFSSGTDLSPESLVFLAALPAYWSAELEGVRVAMWHARPGSDMESIHAETTGPALRRRLLDEAGVDVLIVGHTHDAFVLPAGKGKIVNPGACCSKIYALKFTGSLVVLDGFRVATFGVLELPSKRFSVFRAVDGEQVHGLAGKGDLFATLIHVPSKRPGG